MRWKLGLLVIIAGAIPFAQWAIVMGGDEFTYYGPKNHKVFTYGFPFQIVECAPELPIRTPGWQVPFRFAGNFAVFLGAAFAVAWVITRVGRSADRDSA